MQQADVTESLYHELENQLTKVSVKGKISINLAGVNTVITGKDSVGHIVQEWFFDWCLANNFNVTPNPKTQAFPDYFVDREGDSIGMLEIKNFDYSKRPAFDVADFYAYVETLEEDIEKLYADYIVFGYSLSERGELTMPKIWKMKVWEITGKSIDNHITTQIRNKKCENPLDKKLSDTNIDLKGRIQKFRPYNFKNSNGNNGFSGPLEFLQAIQNLLSHNHDTKEDYKNWLEAVKEAHLDKYNADVS